MTEGLEGDDSALIVDRALTFIDAAAAEDRPFLAVVWLHAPHLPVVADAERARRFADLPLQEQHFLGCLEAVDHNVGRLRQRLRQLGIAAVADSRQAWPELLPFMLGAAFVYNAALSSINLRALSASS